jgi:hypothetical protein
MYRRSLSGPGATWCPNGGATLKPTPLEALWRSWEHLRLDPATGVSVWLRDHLDHHMGVLLDADGPFKGCTRGKAQRAAPQLLRSRRRPTRSSARSDRPQRE